MADLNRDRSGVWPSFSPSAFAPSPEAPAAIRPRTPRRPANYEPSLDEMFADPIFHLLLRRDRLTMPDVLRVIAEARGRLRA